MCRLSSMKSHTLFLMIVVGFVHSIVVNLYKITQEYFTIIDLENRVRCIEQL